MQRFLRVLVGAGPGMQRAGICSLCTKTEQKAQGCTIPVPNKLREEKQSLFPACTSLQMVEPAAQERCPVCASGLELGKSASVKDPPNQLVTPTSETKCAISHKRCFCNRGSDGGEWFTVFRFSHLLTFKHSDIWSGMRQQQHYFCSAAFITIHYQDLSDSAT